MGYEVVFSSSLSLVKRAEGSIRAGAKVLRLADAVTELWLSFLGND